MAIFEINISSTSEKTFVQTNFIRSNGKIIMMSYCECDITDEDAKELAKTLSHICNVDFEDANNNCILLQDGETIKKYKNE